MIAALRGTLLSRESEGIVVEAGGVGYLVQVSSHTFAQLPAPGEGLMLHTRQIVREDALLLFGFANLEERRLFDLLIAVNGVGPRLAIVALSGLAPTALAKAIRDENLSALVVLPGIGRKTAERLVVELRDKLDFIAAANGEPPRRDGILPRASQHEDAVAALTALGFGTAQAQEAVRQLAGDMPDASLEELVRAALARLGRTASLAR